MRLRVGCSGWSYKDWIGAFYPPGTRPGEMLAAYARCFDTVEVDGTFYRMPDARMTRAWADVTPPGFRFVVKLFKGITHELHRIVADDRVEGEIARFVSGVRPLGTKLAATLVQFPPSLTAKGRGDVEALLAWLPRTMRWAIEFRHDSWFDDMEWIAGHPHVSVAGSVHPGVRPFVAPTRTPFVFRFIGDRALTTFSSIQRHDESMAREMLGSLQAKLSSIDEVLVFFNNHYEGFAPASANAFKELAGLPARPFPKVDPRQRSLVDFAGDV